MSLLRQAEAAVTEVNATLAAGQGNDVPRPGAEGNRSKKEAPLDSALSKLLRYVPTEATIIYLAFNSALPAMNGSISWLKPVYIFWAFAVGVSPLLFMLIYFNKLAEDTPAEKPFPGFAGFPWFRFVASGIAFLAWALCIPGNPYVYTDQKDKGTGWGVLWSIVAIAVAIFLPLIENLYNFVRRPPPPSPPPLTLDVSSANGMTGSGLVENS